MADITLCTNKTCQLRRICKRAQTEPRTEWQSWSEFKGGVNCQDFMRMPREWVEEQKKKRRDIEV